MAITIDTYDIGDTVHIPGTFTNSAGNAADPTTVVLKILNPYSVITTYTYGTDVQLVKDSTGTYHVDYVPDTGGMWEYRWEATGAIVTAGETQFYVNRSAFQSQAGAATPSVFATQSALSSEIARAQAAENTLTASVSTNTANITTNTTSITTLNNAVGVVSGLAADGVTNDTAAIQAAIDAANTAGGGRVILPRGKTIRAKGLNLKSNVTLDIPKGTKLKNTDDSITNVIQAVNATNVAVIGGGEIDGNQAAIPQTSQTEGVACIAIQTVTRFRITDVYCHDGRGSCIAISDSSSEGVVSGVRMDVAGNDCLLIIRNCSDVRVSNCYSSNAGGVLTPISGSPQRSGFEVADDCRNIQLDNCVAEACADAGFEMHNHDANSPQGNTGGPYNVTLTNCVSRNAGATTVGGATGLGYGFQILAQAPTGPDSIQLVGCAAQGGDTGFKVWESGSVGTPQLGSVLLSGCIAGGTYTSGNVTYPETGTIGTANSPASFGFYVRVQSTTVRAIVLDGCIAERIGNGAVGVFPGFQLVGATSNLARSVLVSGCYSRGNSGYGFYVTSLADAVLQGCVADGNANYGFSTGPTCKRLQLVGCRASRNNPGGFAVLTDDVSLTGCFSYLNTGTGFIIQANNALLTGCEANANTSQGFMHNGGASTTYTGATFSGCRSTANTSDGLLINPSASAGNINHVTIVGGQYTGNGAASGTNTGIRSTVNSDYIIVSGVIATGNTNSPGSLAQINLDAGGTHNQNGTGANITA